MYHKLWRNNTQGWVLIPVSFKDQWVGGNPWSVTHVDTRVGDGRGGISIPRGEKIDIKYRWDSVCSALQWLLDQLVDDGVDNNPTDSWRWTKPVRLGYWEPSRWDNPPPSPPIQPRRNRGKVSLLFQHIYFI